MTQDIPGDGYYFSAMKAFVTRTAYANIRGDQMVCHTCHVNPSHTRHQLQACITLICSAAPS